MKILLVDDEESIRVLVEMIVTEYGYDFCYAANGEEGLKVFEREQPDLVVLDVMMAKMNGFDVCRKIRESGSDVPIVILSAKGDIVDKSTGFGAGADDYVVKPFSSVELLLRIQAHMRRRGLAISSAGHNWHDNDSYSIGELELAFARQEAKMRGKPMDLTPKEFKILAFLASHPGEIFSREQLQEYVWGKSHSGELASIAVFIRKIREKIEEDPSNPKYLQTIWGMGYKFIEK